MKQAVFIDIEVNPSDNKILDLGAVTSDGHQLHCVSQGEFCDFVSGIEFVGGHNILAHDLTYIGELLGKNAKYIDTLYLSPLLFSTKPYHTLLKDDKLQTDTHGTLWIRSGDAGSEAKRDTPVATRTYTNMRCGIS